MFCSEKILWDYLDSGFFYCFALQRFHFWLSVQKCDSAKKQRDSSKKQRDCPPLLYCRVHLPVAASAKPQETRRRQILFTSAHTSLQINQPKFAQKKARKQNGTEIAVKTIPKKLRKVCTSVVDPDFFDRIFIQVTDPTRQYVENLNK